MIEFLNVILGPKLRMLTLAMFRVRIDGSFFSVERAYFSPGCAIKLLSGAPVFGNRTGKSINDCTSKSNNWLDQWQSDKLGTGSRV